MSSAFMFDETVSKLIVLFAIDKMEVPVSEETVIDICSISNDWVSQMECRPMILHLIDNNFILKVGSPNNVNHYSITQEGRVCLAHFFTRIPLSVREGISEFVKLNRSKYRKKQEYVADHFKNADGTFTVVLKIVEPACNVLEIKMIVPSKQSAKLINKQWEDKAANIYSNLYENLVE